VCTVKNPDDGQRNCPKHVEFYSKNKFEKLVHLVGFIIRMPVLCTLSLVVKNIKTRLEHPVKHNGLDRTSVTVGKFNLQVLL